MDATIVSIGTELITGQTVDTNSAWLSARLTALGARVIRHLTLGDDVGPLVDAIAAAMKSSGLVVITGGLGPTPDDLTREALAGALQAPLQEDVVALQQIEQFFRARQRPMPDSNRAQAMIPRGCTVIPNPRGTAPGIRHESASCLLVALPGVPGEMKPMFDDWVAPVVAARTGGATSARVVLLCFGLAEATVGERLADLMRRGRNPSVGTTASRAVIAVRIVASGRDEAEAQNLAAADAQVVRQRLGEAIFGEGDDTLQAAVGRLLIAAGKTVSTAESCTGGLLAKCLTDVPGSSGYFQRGWITYSNAAKSELLGVEADLIAAHGAVSEEVARAMALGCRARSAADYALSTTGVAGPSGGSAEKPVGLVLIGLVGEGGVEVKRLLLGDTLTREEIRDRACKAALNMLRLRLVGTST